MMGVRNLSACMRNYPFWNTLAFHHNIFRMIILEGVSIDNESEYNQPLMFRAIAQCPERAFPYGDTE